MTAVYLDPAGFFLGFSIDCSAMAIAIKDEGYIISLIKIILNKRK